MLHHIDAVLFSISKAVNKHNFILSLLMSSKDLYKIPKYKVIIFYNVAKKGLVYIA